MGKKIKRVVFFLVAGILVVQLGRQLFMEEEREARNYFYDQVKSVFSDANDKARTRYGITPFSGKKIQVSKPRATPIVLLVHGLDEPGRVWLNLAPVLEERGYGVMFMSYPNDQEIPASARLFFASLKGLGIHPDTPLVIVGHSMGGLVSRQMLTDPDINYTGAAAAAQVPRVRNLIMVGTPNHGSQLARFRFFMEIRDQAGYLFEKDAHWLQGLLDGTGAAGIDLIPGSEFLANLNRRPHPEGVDLHVIAGILSPWNEQDIHGFAQRLETLIPEEKQQGIKGLEKALATINNTIGDGLVTLESAALAHIPLTRVHGSHLTMIRNLREKSSRMPPAIPVILDILEE